MGIFGKIGAGLSQIGKYYTSPEGAQSGLAILQDYGTGGSDNYRALQMQRQKLAQEQQQQQALAALMQRMRPQDTQTPVINNMIDMNNQRMGGFQNGMQHQQAKMDVGKAGLDFSDPETLKAFMGYASMPDANPQLPLALSQAMQPEKPEKMEIQNAGDGYIVGIDPITGEAKPIYQRPDDPLDQAFRQAQIRSLNALGDQRSHAAGKPYFAPPRPRAASSSGPRASGGSSSTLDAIAAELRRRGMNP